MQIGALLLRLPCHTHFARAYCISTLLPACGLWGKCSDLSESRAFGSSSPDMTKVRFRQGHRHILENGLYSYVFETISTKPRRSRISLSYDQHLRRTVRWCSRDRPGQLIDTRPRLHREGCAWVQDFVMNRGHRVLVVEKVLMDRTSDRPKTQGETTFAVLLLAGGPI